MDLPAGIPHATARVRAVRVFYEAMRERRVKDLLALLDAEVVYNPVERPAVSVYEGHEAMARLVDDVHAAYGDYQVEIDKVTERLGETTDYHGAVVKVRATIWPEPARHEPPVLVTSRFTFRAGLIALIDNEPGYVP